MSMKNKFLFIAILVTCVHTNLIAQVSFNSPEFESAVRYHLGLSEADAITVVQLDTITQINLSGIGLSDIGDIRMLSNLKTVNLSNNNINDIKPLVLMETLQKVDLSNNQLESINMLAFSFAKEMEIDVAFNYISDFSIFNTLTPCSFTINGAGLQKEKNAPYFYVSYLFSDINAKNQPIIHYRGKTNTTDNVYLECSGIRSFATMDGEKYSVVVPGNPTTTALVRLANGIQGDSTWVVPILEREIQSGEEITVETGLPEDYTIGSVYGTQGDVFTEQTAIKYQASASFDYEELLYSYYCGSTLKGFSKIVLKSKETPTDIDVIENGKKNLDIRLQGNQLQVKCDAKTLETESVIDVFDISGRLVVSKLVDSTNGIDEQISLASVPRNVIVVRVTSRSKRFVDKISVK